MKVGFVGVGFMGRHMARNVLNGGHEMSVFDANREAADELLSLGATWANSPREAAEGCEVTFTSLPTPQVVEEVASGEGGILSGAGRGSALFDLSTTDPSTIQRIAARAEASGIQVLDAPVSGGTGGAEAATLCVMVGGDSDTYDRYKPVLDLIGDKVMYCGGLGSGAVCKIVNNLVGLSVGVLLSEAFSVGVKWGVDAQTLYEAVLAAPVTQPRCTAILMGSSSETLSPGSRLTSPPKTLDSPLNWAARCAFQWRCPTLPSSVTSTVRIADWPYVGWCSRDRPGGESRSRNCAQRIASEWIHDHKAKL